MSSGAKTQTVSPQSADGSNELIGSIISPPSTNRSARSEDNPSGGFQLRTSARVSKKLKLEAEAAAHPPPEPKEHAEAKKPPEPEKAPKRKAHELWSTEDKNTFFEALNECGKDFDGIAKYMMGKVKKKGTGGGEPHCSKTRAQVRCFYYRTWHKIGKHLNFPDGIQKLTQELYGLINFGEMRKKCGVITLKNCCKLNELIYAGSTQIRIKGKTLRVRTPNCRAMRKVNHVVESEEDKIPGRILVEFHPKDKSTWLSIQSLSFNPRVKTTVTHHTKLATLLNYLQNVKWKQAEGTLRVAPPPDATISLPQVKRNESNSNAYWAFSLLNHEKKFGSPSRVTEIMSLLNQIRHSTPSSRKRQRADSSSEKAKMCERDSNSCDVEKKDPGESCYDATLPAFCLPVFSTEEGGEGEVTVDIHGSQGTSPPMVRTPTTSPNKEEVIGSGLSDESKDLPKVESILKGWSLGSVANTQVGHLYSMFGNEGKVILTYSWEDVKPKVDISATLQHMLLVAKLILNKNKTVNTPGPSCSCEHICDTKTSVASLDGAKSAGDTFKKPKPIIEPRDEFQAQLDKFQPKSYSRRFRSKNLIVHRVHPLNSSPTSPSSSLAGKSLANVGQNSPSSSSMQTILAQSVPSSSTKSRPESYKPTSVQSPLTLSSSSQPSTSHSSLPVENPTKNPTSGPPVISSMPLLDETPPSSPAAPDNSRGPPIVSSVQYSTPVISTTSRSEESGENVARALSASGNGSANNSSDTNDFLGNLMDTSMSSTIAKEAVAVLDELMDISFPNSELDPSTSSPSSFSGLIPTKNDSMSLPPSPSKFLMEGENKWLSSEVADYSLSSLLGHLESPVKPSIPADMQSLISESSVDYMAKFADLAAQMANDETCKN